MSSSVRPPDRLRRSLARLTVLAVSAVVAAGLEVPRAAATVAPEWRQEAEAFATKSTGAQATDANASGGATWNLWTNGYVETSFTTSSSGAKQLDITARGNVAAGVWPIMRVFVDGVQRSEFTVASYTFQTYSTTLSSLGVGNHTLKIDFNNDAIVAGEDRNLKVDVASVIPAAGVEQWRQEAESFPTVSGSGQIANDALASGGKYRDQWANGYIETTMTVPSSGTKQLVVYARGTVADSVWPNMRVIVDGVTLANVTVGSTTWTPYPTVLTLSKGSHTLRLQFTNDANINGQDRNLKMDVASLVPVPHEWKQEAEAFDSRTVGQATPSTLASGGIFWNLWSNGSLTTSMHAASAGRKELHLIARGSQAGGVYPNLRVHLGTTVVTNVTIDSETFTKYVVPLSVTTFGPHTLRLEFTNDSNTNGDRNVHLDVATLVGDNAFPFVQSVASPASNSYVPDRPPLRVTYADPDGDAGYVDYELYLDGGTTPVQTARSALTNAGDVAAWTPATLSNNQKYRWRARAYDGTSYAGAWTANQFFTVDATPPSMPTVSSATFPSGAWSGTDTTSGTFTFGNGGSTDVVGYKYGLDQNPPRTDTTATSVTLTPGEGAHVLYVQSVDRAGNLSQVRDYAFNVASGAVTSPREGDATAKRFLLRAVANPSITGATYQWRRAATDSWTDVPAAHVTFHPSGTGIGSWPVAVATGTHTDLQWDVAQTLGNVDGPFELRVLFAGGATTRGTKVRLDHKSSAAPTAPAGPGAVNLLTGNLTLSATDVSVEAFASDLTVTRAFSSRDPGAGANGPFGPGWVAGTPVASASSPYSGLTATGSLRTVSFVDGDTVGFTATSATSFVPEKGMEGLTLTRTAGAGTTSDHTDDVYELADLAGNKTVFTWQSTAFLPTTVVQPGSNVSTTYTYETVGGVTRVARMLAPVPAGVTCTSPATTRGCRSLTFDYAPSGTPVPGPSGGDYAGRLRSVSLTAWDPATSAMATVELARWSYDPNGRLLAAWDPRLPSLKTTYAYDSGGRVVTLTPPGEEPYTFAYTTLPDDPNGGRLKSVSRSALSAGTATTTFVYRVPVTGTGAPVDLSATQLARWGQRSAPVDATAVFPPTQVPDGDQAAGVLPSSYERATVSYLDVTGRLVNTRTPGNHVSATDYDEHGNVVRSLTADNRRAALDAFPADTAAQEAALASRLSTLRTYAAEGQRLVEELGPEHEVALAAPVTDSLGRAWPAGALVRARSRTVNTYDEGAPSGTGPYHLVTTSVTGARIADTTTDTDLRTTTTAYDWTLRKPTAVTQDPGGLNLVTRTAYDSATGLVTRSTIPGGTSAQDTAHTTVSTYYAAGAHPAYSECGNRPEWANLLCRIDVAAQPTVTADRPAIPSKHYEYDVFHTATTTREKNGATVLRTWTTQYDSAHRPWRTSVTATTGEPLPTVETYYDPATGRATETRALDGAGAVTSRVTRAFDTLGRLTSYTDADGTTSTTTYDIASRPVTTDDGKGTQTRYYDEGAERRGLVTRLVDSAAGTFTATYDADGRLATETLPNGLVRTLTYDETGAAVRLAYAKSGSTWLSFSVNESVHGQWLAATASGLSSQEYAYDAAGRLTRVADTVAGAGCTLRTYAVDADANRTSLTTRPPTSEGECDSGATGTTVSYTYDAASRITTSGYVYDALGRTTSVPAADAGGKTLAATYFVNDLVRSLTPENGDTTTWALDPTQQRFGSWTRNGVTRTNHYSGDGDNPSWVAEGGTAFTRNVAGIGGDLAALHDASGVTLQLTNLHGDVVATASTSTTATAPTATFESTEFGAPRVEAGKRYGWLGGKTRSADAPSGLVLMGVRLYNPATGRFLQVDPVPGGSHNPYDYAGHDPVNAFDLDGRINWNKWGGRLNTASTWLGYAALGAAVIPGGQGFALAFGGLSAVASFGASAAYAKGGNKKAAAHAFVGGMLGSVSFGMGTAAKLAFQGSKRFAQPAYHAVGKANKVGVKITQGLLWGTDALISWTMSRRW